MLNPSGSYELAVSFINATNRNVLLTGKAGTGKTTLLKTICSHTLKNSVVLAPTGVAAINAGGSTIHSFFSLPFHPFLPTPNGKHDLISTIKLSKEKKEILQSLELLIIDEISMVRCDILDAIDSILRISRSRPFLPFGGVQLLMIGDLYQLPPVVRPAEWNILKTNYQSPFFFHSQVMLSNPPVYIELDVVFRQKDPAFITLLNQVRNNILDRENYDLLHERMRINHVVEGDLVTLTTHNQIADEINKSELKKLPAQAFSFQALIEGTFQQSNFPADEIFHVKEGASVMFIKNDTDPARRYYNGKTGIVKKINEDDIIVSTDNGALEITVKKETWKNIHYSVNRSTGKMEEDVLGRFVQFPLRLAWAITIHKSQGLTFDKILIDAGAAFAPGQVYVALSRCRSLEGIYLSKRIEVRSLYSEPEIVKFVSEQAANENAARLLPSEIAGYEKELLVTAFDPEKAVNEFNEMNEWVKKNQLGGMAESWLNEISTNLNLFSHTAQKFINTLHRMFEQDGIDEVMQERIKAAAVYFSPLFSSLLNSAKTCNIVSDNRQASAEFNEKSNDFFRTVHFIKYNVDSLGEGFTRDVYLARKKEYIRPAPFINIYENAGRSSAGDNDNALYRLLVDKRNEIAEKENRPRYLVISTVSIKEMAEKLPVNKEQLSAISGFGKIKIRQYGQIFLDIITDYCDANQIVPDHTIEYEKKRGKEKRSKKTQAQISDTKKTTYELFRSGKSVAEIAAERNLVVGTIESHLAACVEKGILEVDMLMNKEKVEPICEMINKNPVSTLSQLKEKLPDYSYSEIRFATAYTKFLEAASPNGQSHPEP